jgi:hypothetical protein
MIFQHAEMDEDVALAIVADEEAETTRGIEPFDPAANEQTRRLWRDIVRSLVVRH